MPLHYLIFFAVEKNLEVIMSNSEYSPLLGEVNLVRFLSRIGPKEFNYENNVELSTEIDSLLDLCYQLVNCQNTRERSAHLRILNAKLKKTPYFGGESISILDVIISSTIYQLPVIGDLPPSLSSWLSKVKTDFLF